MFPARYFFLSLLIAIALPGWGCFATGGGSSGQVVIGTSAPSPASAPASGGSQVPGQAKGHDVAARNHLRSAYRFLEMGKPEHARKELEKARRKMGEDYWFHYYLGGALYLQGSYMEARMSWDRAYAFAGDARLRSRARTCQSYAVNRVEGSAPSVGFLRQAIELDRENLAARELYREMAGDQEPASLKGPGAGKKPDNAAGKGGGKKSGGGKKIEEDQAFREYFLIQMPAD